MRWGFFSHSSPRLSPWNRASWMVTQPVLQNDPGFPEATRPQRLPMDPYEQFAHGSPFHAGRPVRCNLHEKNPVCGFGLVPFGATAADRRSKGAASPGDRRRCWRCVTCLLLNLQNMTGSAPGRHSFPRDTSPSARDCRSSGHRYAAEHGWRPSKPKRWRGQRQVRMQLW
jgi:hypothetical protein